MRKVQLEHFPDEIMPDTEVDKIIEAWGPRVEEMREAAFELGFSKLTPMVIVPKDIDGS